MYTSDHTGGTIFVEYEFKEDKKGFVQHLNMYNPDIEITTE